MRTLLCLIPLLIASAIPAYADERVTGWCMQGGQVVVTPGVANSTTKVQRSYPMCTVTVYNAGTLTLATIYSDNSNTPLANPFTGSITGFWGFYAADGRYDVVLSGASISSPITLADFVLHDSVLGITTLNALTAVSQSFATGTSGSDFNIASSTATHTFNFPSASASNRGLLTAADWTTFNGKQGGLSFSAPLVNTSGTVAITLPLTIPQGGTGQITQTLGFNALAPLTTKGDMILFDGTNNVRLAIGTNGQFLTADSAQATGVRWTATTITNSVANGLTGGTSFTGILVGNTTSPFTATAGTAGLQSLRFKANQTTDTYEFAGPQLLLTSDFDFAAQTPGGTLTAAVGATVTLTPCPLGVNGADTLHSLYITGGTGSAEAVAITGGTCTSGATTGNVTFTPANSHSGAFTILSATNGAQEAVCYLSAATNEVRLPQGTTTLNANLSFCGKVSAVLMLSDGLTLAGTGTLPAVGARTFIIDRRSGLLFPGVGANLSSGTTIAPTNGLHHITGGSAIVNITVPTGFISGCINFIPDGAYTMTNAGNIAIASTATVSRVMVMCYDTGTSKWYPSY